MVVTLVTAVLIMPGCLETKDKDIDDDDAASGLLFPLLLIVLLKSSSRDRKERSTK